MKPVTLCMQQVTKVVGGGSASRVLVENCSFNVGTGSLTVLIGPSGCGKTTIINMIAGYEQVTNGRIIIDNLPVRGPGPDRLVVFQESALFQWMTTLENVMYGPSVRGGMGRREIKKNALALLSQVGLAGFGGKYPSQLSGGMQRRAELARALINEPKVLLLDEPFRGLDAMTRELMQEYLLKLFEDRHTTILFVTCEIDEAIFLADEIILLSAGPARVAATIEVDLPRPRTRVEVLASTRYAELKQTCLDLLYAEAAGSFAAELRI